MMTDEEDCKKALGECVVVLIIGAYQRRPIDRQISQITYFKPRYTYCFTESDFCVKIVQGNILISLFKVSKYFSHDVPWNVP